MSAFKVTPRIHYNPGYPALKKKTGIVFKMPLRVLNIFIVGFLFCFLGSGCGNEEQKLTGVQELDGDILQEQPDTADVDRNTYDYDQQLSGTDAPDVVLDQSVPDDLGGVTDPDFPDTDIVVQPDNDEQLAGEYIPDTPMPDAEDADTCKSDKDCTDSGTSDSDSSIYPDEELSGVVAPDAGPLK